MRPSAAELRGRNHCGHPDRRLPHRPRSGWKKTVGILTAYLGILLIIGLGQRETGAILVGDRLVLCVVLCAAVRTSLVRDVLRRVTLLQLTFHRMHGFEVADVAL